jgi:glycosyltransferase involved in cell wall biosynthesis
MKVAIVHDWFASKTGGENCVEQLLLLYPQADVFTIVEFLSDEERRFLDGHKVTTSFIQRLPGARKRYRSYLPLMPIAVEQFDMTGYDLIISTSSAVAKGVITGPDQVHVSYTLSPIRYAWDLQETYLREANSDRGVKGAIARTILHYIRLWDTRTANGVDHFIAISHFIARRIRKVYGRASTVIYPPVNLDRFQLSGHRDDFYVTMSRLVPYKRIPLIVEAFAAMPERRLVVIGDGPDMAEVRRLAGPNVTVMGKQPDAVVVDHLQRAKAFIFAAEEDFGIAPLEAQACGTPVIAYGKGGALETIRGHDSDEGQTGVFFPEQTTAAIRAAVERLEGRMPFITAEACRANADRFSTTRFRAEIERFVADAMARAADGVALTNHRSVAPSIDPDARTIASSDRVGP